MSLPHFRKIFVILQSKTADMKKLLPAIITFLIVWIIGFGVLWLAEITTGLHNMPRWVYYTVIGLIGVLIGLLGPKISDGVIRKFKKS